MVLKQATFKKYDKRTKTTRTFTATTTLERVPTADTYGDRRRQRQRYITRPRTLYAEQINGQ